jgi:hypothetical protein
LAVLAALPAAILLPSITISDRLPDFRLEQLLLPYALLVLCIEWRQGLRFRPGFIDWVFAALALSTLASITLSPLILHTHLSPRDFYELLKLALYYAIYRLAMSAGSASDQRRLLGIFLAAGSLSAALGVAQYFDWLRVNLWLTPRFAPDLHLNVVRTSGRVVGTFANPNYFGIFCAMLALGCVVAWWLPEGSVVEKRAGSRLTRPGNLPLAIATALASLGIVMSGSRTAALALAAGLVTLAFYAAVRRMTGQIPRLAAGLAALLLLLALSVAVVEVFPRGQVDYIGRVGGGLSSGDDASFGLRLARWHSVLNAWIPRSKTLSDASSHSLLTSVHATGVQPAPAAATARDDRRKSDLATIASALDAYHRDFGRWPQPDSLNADLVPRYLPALPADPVSGGAYSDISVVSGYSLVAQLENPADPDYPTYAIGSSPNYLQNGDLERGNPRPSNWDTISGTSIAIQPGNSLYGYQSVLFRGNGDHPEQRTGIYQQRYFGRPGGDPFTATVWIKLLPNASGSLELYANVIYADGQRADPLTQVPADMSKTGVWQRLSLWMLPPSGNSLAFLGIYVISDGFRGEALLDGFQLVDGPAPLSFAMTPEAPPSDALGFNADAKLRQSPLIGVGPQKGEQGSSLDDEYLLYAARYGLIGIALYLALYFGTFTLAIRAFARSALLWRPLCLLVSLSVVMFLVFNITAGSFYELQLMAIFWLLTGAAISAGPKTDD